MSPAGRERAGSALRWGCAFAVAIAVHAAVGIVLFQRDAEPGWDVPGPPAITIELLPAEPEPSAAPAAAPSREPVPPSSAPEPATETEMEPVPDVPDPAVPPPDATATTAEARPPDAPAPDLPRLPAILADDAVAVAPPPTAVPVRPPVVRRPAESPAIDKRPPRPVRAAERGADRPERRPPAPASGSRTSNATLAGGGSSAATSAAWRSQLLAYLQGRVRAPAGAGSSVGVNFSVGRGGQITSARLSRSSGDAAVDGAALAAFRGAVPPPPADYAGPLAFNTNIRIR